MNPLLSNASRPEVMKLAAAYELIKEAAADPKRLAGMADAVKKMKGAVSSLPVKVKTATGPAGHAVELAGLGILARPSVRKLRGKEQSEKSTHIHEAVGLGTLAAPSAIELGKSAIKRFGKKAIVKHASVHERIKTAASNGFGQFMGRAAHIAEKAVKPAASTVAQVGQKAVEAPKKKLTMDMIQAAKKRMASGGHGGIY